MRIQGDRGGIGPYKCDNGTIETTGGFMVRWWTLGKREAGVRGFCIRPRVYVSVLVFVWGNIGKEKSVKVTGGKL
jgi:hypothetical protein